MNWRVVWLVHWLFEMWIKIWPKAVEGKKSKLPWYAIEEDIQIHGEILILREFIM